MKLCSCGIRPSRSQYRKSRYGACWRLTCPKCGASEEFVRLHSGALEAARAHARWAFNLPSPIARLLK